MGGDHLNKVVISGPGHHERAQAALAIIRSLSNAHFEVIVESDLRPRLATDLAGLLEAGATRAILLGSGIRAIVTSDVQEFDDATLYGPKTVVVELIAGVGRIKAEIVESNNEVDLSSIMECIQ